jgi:tellurite resistance protein TerC
VTVPLWAWLAVLGAILAMLAIDLFAHRQAHVIGVREAAGWSAFWVVCGVSFGVLIWSLYGAEFGQQYFAGYLIEKSLSVDNVFVWAVIFSFFAVPRELQHRVLFFGVLGALVLRGLFIAGGSVLIASSPGSSTCSPRSWSSRASAWRCSATSTSTRRARGRCGCSAAGCR